MTIGSFRGIRREKAKREAGKSSAQAGRLVRSIFRKSETGFPSEYVTAQIGQAT